MGTEEKPRKRLFDMSRRTFLKASAITMAAATLSAQAAPAALAATDAPTSATEVKRVRTACRGCGKMECGVWVTVENGRAVKVEGDDSAFHSNGNCCTKSQSSIQAAYHPDRLYHPMKRTNPKDADDPGWVRISWDEAFESSYKGLKEVYDKYGEYGLMNYGGTSRMWADGLVVRDLFHAINGHNAVQICKGPRRMIGASTIENGLHWHSTIDYPPVFVQWGSDQTQSNYDDSCRTVNEAAQRADTFISIDPRVSNCGHSADYHIALRPGTDFALALGWMNMMMDRNLYDDFFCRYWTNAPFLVCDDIEPSGWTGVKGNVTKGLPVKTRLLKESDLVEGGNPRHFMVWDEATNALTWFDADEDNTEHGGMWERQTEFDIPTTGYIAKRGGWVPDNPDFSKYCIPALWSGDGFDVTLKDGRTVKVKTAWQRYWDDCVSEWTLEKTAATCDVDAKIIEDAFMAWITRKDPRVGNGALGAQLAPEQTGNPSQTFRAIFILMMCSGNYDVPGGNRAYTRHNWNSSNLPYRNKWMKNPHKAYSATDDAPTMEIRKDAVGVKKFPLTAWWDVWIDTTSSVDAALTGDPYPIKGGFCGGGDFMNQGNAIDSWNAWCQMDFTVVWDLWDTPQAHAADIVMPCLHWMEVPGWLRGAQGAHGGLGANCQCIEPPADCKGDWDIEMGIMKAGGQNCWDTSDGGDAFERDFKEALDKHVRTIKPGKGCDLSFKDWDDFEKKFQEHGWWYAKEIYPQEWGNYKRYSMGYLRNGQSAQTAGKAEGVPGFGLPTMKAELWSTIWESVVPEETHGFTALPSYREPPISPVSTPEIYKEYPFVMTTGRRIPVYFHNEHRQLPWCREIWPAPRCEINPHDAKDLGIEQGDWVWIESPVGKVRQTADLCHGVKPGVINCEHSWWFPELECATKGFDLCGIECILDPHAQDYLCGSSQLRGQLVKIYKATPGNSPFGNPVPCGPDGTEIIHDACDPRLKKWKAGVDKFQGDPDSRGEE